jgi:tetratricopeptide (TPR) repeat protein
MAQVAQWRDLSPDERVVRLCLVVNQQQPRADSMPAMRRLDSVETLARQLGDDRLFWYTRLHRIRCRAIAHGDYEKVMTVYARAEAGMEQCPEAVVRASFYCYYGQIAYQYQDYDKAFKLLFRARSLFEKIGYANIPQAVEYLTLFGNHYYGFEDYQKAIYYLEQALRSPHQELYPTYIILNTLGMAHQRLKQYEQAERMFRRVVELARKANYAPYVGIGMGNLGNTLRLMGQNRQALPYLYADLALNETSVPENSAITCLYIAQALMALDSTAKAKAFIARAQELKQRSVNWDRTSYPLYYYQTQTLYAKKTGDYRRATAYLDSTLLLNDSLRVVFSNKILANAESSINAEQYLSNLQQAETEKQYAVNIRNLMLVALLVLGLAVVYALNQKRQKLQQEQQVQAARREQAEAQLAHAQAQLDQYVGSLKAKNDLIEQISGELASARRDLTEADSAQIARVTTLLDSVILTDKDWLRFRQLFEQAHPGFFDKLHQAQPDLTPAEVRLLTLLKLDIPTKEMGFMLGISAESIRKSRYRLRRKLDGLQAETPFRSLIEQL